MLDVEQDIIRQIGVCLNDEERRRAQGLGLEQDRRRFVAARGQLRRVLASKLGISPSDVELECGRLGTPPLSHRMPASDLRFSFSRSAAVAVIALDRARGRSGHRGSSPFARGGRSAFPPPSTSPTPPLVRNTGWKASSSAGAGWRLSARPWGAAWDRAGPAKWRSIEYRRHACRRRRSIATFSGGSNSDEIYLRDNRRLATQLQGLERRIARGGQGQHRSRPRLERRFGERCRTQNRLRPWDPACSMVGQSVPEGMMSKIQTSACHCLMCYCWRPFVERSSLSRRLVSESAARASST